MSKLKLTPDPTFKAIVGIPVPGGEPAPVEFTFKYRTQSDMDAWVNDPAKTNLDAAKDCIIDWDLDDECNADNIALLCDRYGGAVQAILSSYIKELRGARAKN